MSVSLLLFFCRELIEFAKANDNVVRAIAERFVQTSIKIFCFSHDSENVQLLTEEENGNTLHQVGISYYLNYGVCIGLSESLNIHDCQ